MPFDPAQPAPNSPLASQVMRDQLNALHGQIAALAAVLETRMLETAVNPFNVVEGLGLIVSDPPTRGDVQLIADKLDTLISTLRRPH